MEFGELQSDESDETDEKSETAQRTATRTRVYGSASAHLNTPAARARDRGTARRAATLRLPPLRRRKTASPLRALVPAYAYAGVHLEAHGRA